MSTPSTRRITLPAARGLPDRRAIAHGSRARHEEDQLLLRVASGDGPAFRDLVDRLRGPVHRVATGVIRDPALAEEISQEALLDVWRTAGRFDPCRGSARAWILTTTRRRAIDRVRSEQAARERTRRVAIRDRAPAFDPVVEQILLDEEHTAVRTALTALTDRQRCAIDLAYYQGYTYREVAELLGTPLGTVKTRIRVGLGRLRDAMEPPVAASDDAEVGPLGSQGAVGVPGDRARSRSTA